jgi:hypothetical protein
LVERYLAARGLVLPDAQDIRFHPRLLHVPTRTERPAMVALMRDIKTNAPTGLHRTYLSDDGRAKAPVTPVKMMLGRSSGACVKLVPDDEVTMGLGIAEGIETAIAAMIMGAPPMWALLSANGVKHFPVLAGIETLTICADDDEAGLSAARDCAVRWRESGCEVLMRSPGAHEDWADVAKCRVGGRASS